MKAVLVIDVPIEMLNDDNTCVTITSLHSGMSFNAKLKPLPRRQAKDNSNEVNLGFELGWNACIEELEK